MATIERLKKRPDFLAAAEGRRFHTERMTAQGRLRNPDACPGLRLGFTITKRVGHATERNRIRRRLRAALSVVASDLPGELAEREPFGQAALHKGDAPSGWHVRQGIERSDTRASGSGVDSRHDWVDRVRFAGVGQRL